MFKQAFSSILLLFVFFTSRENLYSQQYPIQLTTQLAPPFSGYLEDYSDDVLQKMRLIVLQTDLTEPSYSIKLKIKIEGQGIKIESNNNYYAGPFTLSPGIPILLSGSDFSGLLNINNLSFSGLKKNDYEKSKVLPEGFYEICITAYDYNNPVPIQVSNISCTQAWMMHNDPPYLNLPACGSTLTTQEPQNIIFQWTGMNLLSLNSAAPTEYEFSLYEIRPASQNPNNIVQTIPPIYQTTLTVPLVNYGITEPPLIKGMSYVWRVKAIDPGGREFYKNKGYSQVCTFTYGSILDDLPELVLKATPQNTYSAKFYWDPISNYNNYTVEYRKTGNENYHWFSLNTTSNNTTAYDLEANTEYKARLKGITKDKQESSWSEAITFTTLQKKEYTCGDMPTGPPIPGAPLQTASENMIWQVGQFEMQVITLYNNISPLGRYSGEGKIFVPFMGILLNVEFENILVDEARVVVAGEVRAKSKGIDKWEEDIEIKRAEEEATYTNETLDSVWYNNGQVCYTTKENQNPVCEPADTTGNKVIGVVRDGEGNQTIVFADGTTKYKNYLKYSSDSLSATTQNQITFKLSNSQQWGFDAKTHAAFTENYEVIKLSDNSNYFVSHKAIGENGADKVIGEIRSGAVIDNSLISFFTQNKTKLNHTSIGNNQYEITIPHDAQCVYAYYNGERLGKLNIISLKPITKKLVLVPVSHSTQYTAHSIQEGLNNIYKQANITWQVSIAPTFNNTTWDINNDNKLEGADAKLFDKYSEEMRKLKSLYQQHDSTYDKKAHYVFVVNGFSNPAQQGYMVRNKAVGFITASVLASPPPLGEAGRGLAHELAHGAFGLEHTFPKAPQGSTNNLMDYLSSPLGGGQEGAHLTHAQWKQMHSLLPQISWLDDEEDGAFNRYAQYGLTPSGIAFDEFYVDNIKIPSGQVKRFIGSKKYFISAIEYKQEKYNWDETINAFVVGTKKITVKKSFQKSLNEVNVYKPVGDNCTYHYCTINWKDSDALSANIEAAVESAMGASPNWLTAMLKENSPHCEENFLKDAVKKETDCTEENILKGDDLLKQNLTSNQASHLSSVINAACIQSLRKLSYSELEKMFAVIVAEKKINNVSEIALLRLMNAMQPKDYKLFFDLLSKNNHQILLHLINEVEDSRLPWYNNNYTSFMGAILWMFNNATPNFWESQLADDDKLLKTIICLDGKFTSETANVSGNYSKSGFKYEGTYNESNASIKLELIRFSEVSTHQSFTNTIIEHERTVVDNQLTPFTPLIITSVNNLPLVATALESADMGVANTYLVPAIFFKYLADKKFEDAVEKTAMISLDVITIASSGGAALATKLPRLKRIWALMELTGAVGNIASTTTTFPPGSKAEKIVNAYNMALGAIGLKNVGKGIYQYTKDIPQQAMALIKQNKEIRAIVLSAYSDYMVAITKLDNLSEAEKQMLNAGKIEDVTSLSSAEKQLLKKQREAFEYLGAVDGVGATAKMFKNVGYNDFIKTFTATEEQYKKAYQLWGEEKWSELEQFFKQNNLNNGLPPFYGFKTISKIESGVQLAGKTFDRFQGPGGIKGEYASPVYNGEDVGDLHFTYDSRALGSDIKEGTNYIKFKFKANIPNDVTFEYGDIIPWFGKSGLGDQIKSSRNFVEIEEYIEIVEHLEFRQGIWKSVK